MTSFKSAMVIVIRWWSNADNMVKTRYFDSTFMGHGREVDLLRHFNTATSEIDRSKVYHISMDGPSVNHKFLKSLKVAWQNLLVHKLIYIGSCNLHIISGAFKTGAQKTGWNIDKTLKGSYQIFHETPARREDYELVNSCDSYPKFFTATRWVENEEVADTLVELWPCIQKLFQWWSKQKGRQPSALTSKSMTNVKTALSDILTETKLHHFSFLAGKLQSFLLKYQAKKPMIVFLCRDLT